MKVPCTMPTLLTLPEHMITLSKKCLIWENVNVICFYSPCITDGSLIGTSDICPQSLNKEQIHFFSYRSFEHIPFVE